MIVPSSHITESVSLNSSFTTLLHPRTALENPHSVLGLSARPWHSLTSDSSCHFNRFLQCLIFSPITVVSMSGYNGHPHFLPLTLQRRVALSSPQSLILFNFPRYQQYTPVVQVPTIHTLVICFPLQVFSSHIAKIINFYCFIFWASFPPFYVVLYRFRSHIGPQAEYCLNIWGDTSPSLQLSLDWILTLFYELSSSHGQKSSSTAGFG